MEERIPIHRFILRRNYVLFVVHRGPTVHPCSVILGIEFVHNLSCSAFHLNTGMKNKWQTESQRLIEEAAS